MAELGIPDAHPLSPPRTGFPSSTNPSQAEDISLNLPEQWTERPQPGAHPLAGLIPGMQADEYAALVADIGGRGLLEPIVLHEGLVLDGRHRYRACIDTGVEPRFRDYEGDDAVGFVVAMNILRRHLTPSQRAVLALGFEAEYAKDAKERQGARTDLTSSHDCEKVEPVHAAALAAAALEVSPRLVSDAKAIGRDAPDLLARVASGELTIPEAKRETRQRAKAVTVAAIRDREPGPLQSLGPFPVLYADPPWQYEEATTEPTRVIENHYPTMTLGELKALEVPACDNATLFLWATSPKLAEALEVMGAWGFRYRTCMVWVKDRIGMGYYARQRHELLLIGERGKVPRPDPEDRPDSVVTAPRTEHSVKPFEFYRVIERMYPTLERVELFARQPRDGWASWGNQA